MLEVAAACRLSHTPFSLLTRQPRSERYRCLPSLSGLCRRSRSLPPLSAVAAATYYLFLAAKVRRSAADWYSSQPAKAYRSDPTLSNGSEERLTHLQMTQSTCRAAPVAGEPLAVSRQ